MVNHKRAVACLVGMAAVAGPAAGGDEVFWVSEFSESWHNGFNWSTGSPPAPRDTAFIDVAEDIVVTHSQGATLVAGLLCEERFRLIGASSLGFTAVGKFNGLLTIDTTGGLFTELPSSEINLFGPTNYNAGEIGGAGSIINGGMMTISGNGEKTISAEFENNSLGSMNLQQETLLTFDLNGDAFVNRGQFDQHGDIILIGQIENLDGGFYNMITITFPSIHGMGNAVFNNAGSFSCSSGTQASLCDLFFNNTGSVEISRDGQVSWIDVLFDNSGMIDIQPGGMMIDACMQSPVTNSGAVHVAGTLSLTGPAPTSYVQTAGSTMLDLGTIMAEGAVDIQGGEIAGIGSINGELLLGCGDAVGASSRGLVALADPRPSPLCPDCTTGVIEVIGDFTQCELGELEIAFFEPVGAEAGHGSVHDRLAVSAVATLGGKLTVTLDGPFDPLDGAVFDVLTAEAIMGEFSEVEVPILPGDRTFEVIYNPNTVQLKVVAVAPCPADFDNTGDVGVNDLLFLLGTWGDCQKKGDCPADFDNTGDVGVNDLLFLLGTWGLCP